ncbi:MAG: ferredoxin [Spirochaetes bacterium]|nr:MAG: ferredoxin [Spirochaetota bacterium]
MHSLIIDPDLCIGCGLCVEICPKVFELREEKVWLIKPKVFALTERRAVARNTEACAICDCELVIDSCPVAAISYEPAGAAGSRPGIKAGGSG